jgi:hypothetical protein
VFFCNVVIVFMKIVFKEIKDFDFIEGKVAKFSGKFFNFRDELVNLKCF